MDARGQMIQDESARMTSPPRSILLLAFLLTLDPPSHAQSAAPPASPPAWAVTSAPARFIVDTGDPQPGPRLMQVNLFLPDPKWETMPIRVFTDAGVAVGSDLLWTAPGEPATLLFDSSSGAKRYKVYVGSNWPALHVPDVKAGVWMESRAGDGKLINKLPDMLQAWNQSTKVIGRAISDTLFVGGNPFGPQVNLLTHFQGWFDLPTPEHLQLAAVSVDAAFVLVDGKEVVESPGQHDRWYGPAGPPQVAVDLAAGPHLLEFYNAYVASPDGNPPLTCALAVKGGRFTDWTMITGTAYFFRRVGSARVVAYELQKDIPGAVTSGIAPTLALDWTLGDESVINTDVADIGLISLQLNCPCPPKGTFTWTFDDGSTAQGQNVTHLFLRPGMRTIHLSLRVDDKEVGALDQTVSVHADWANPGMHPELRNDQEAAAMRLDPASLPVSDLAGCFALFGFYLKVDDLQKLAPALTAKMNGTSDADLPYVLKGATLLAREDWAHADQNIQLLRALIDRCGQGTPSPQVHSLASEARLALARLIFKTSDKLDDVKALVDAINVTDLTGDEPRILSILQADLALAAGDVPGARRHYVALTAEPSGPDVRSSIRRTAKISQARAFIDRKDFDAAEDALNEVAWNEPIEKLSPEWALTRLRLYQEENLPQPAYIWAKRLQPVLIESGRSELLFRLTDLAFAQGDSDLARKTLSELLLKHPYSEEAAEAKERWPGKE
jgi:hypothetical protein